MATATATQGTSQVIQDLLAEAGQLEKDYRAKHGEIMAKIRDAADAEAGDFSVGNSSPPVASAPASTGAPPAKKHGGGAPKKKTASKPTAKRGAGSKKKAAKKKGKVAPADRNYDNELTLPQAIWDALDREAWPSLPDVPSDAVGLRAGEIKMLLDQEGKWQSSSEDPGNQISGQLGKFKKAGKIALGDNRRYYIVAGAELDGPNLDSAGNPIS